jgi:hypothetical protein
MEKVWSSKRNKSSSLSLLLLLKSIPECFKLAAIGAIILLLLGSPPPPDAIMKLPLLLLLSPSEMRATALSIQIAVFPFFHRDIHG